MAPVYRVTVEGLLRELGTLVPVYPEGFVMVQPDGVNGHTDGLPWWLFDMRPQGYLGRAYSHRHGPALGLPERLTDWNDSHVMRALLRQGGDLPGNLLVGAAAQQEPCIPIDQSALRKAGTLRVIFALLTVEGLAAPAVAPLLLVYADLMVSNEGRSVEVAGMLMEWLKNAEGAGLVFTVAGCLF